MYSWAAAPFVRTEEGAGNGHVIFPLPTEAVVASGLPMEGFDVDDGITEFQLRVYVSTIINGQVRSAKLVQKNWDDIDGDDTQIFVYFYSGDGNMGGAASFPNFVMTMAVTC